MAKKQLTLAQAKDRLEKLVRELVLSTGDDRAYELESFSMTLEYHRQGLVSIVDRVRKSSKH